MVSIVININGHRKPHETEEVPDIDELQEEDDLEYFDFNTDWPDQAEDESVDAITELSPQRIAAIVVRGCFGLYHLVREHADQRTSVPSYLLQFARDYEDPIIPAAEQLYFSFFCENGERPDEIPRDLYELGCVECKDVDRCSAYAQRLHTVVEALAAFDGVSHPLLPTVFRDGETRLLMQVVLVEYHRWTASRGSPD